MNARRLSVVGALLAGVTACSSPDPAPVTVVATFDGVPLAIAAGSDAVFVSTVFGDTGRLLRIGDGEETPIELVADAPRAVAIALSDADVYWAELGAPGATPGKGAIKRVARGGGAPQVVAADVVSPLALAVSAARVVWTASDGVYGLELDEGAMPRLLVEGALATSLAMDEENVYFAETELGLVSSAPAIGGDAKLVGDGQARPRGLAVGKAGLFWSIAPPPSSDEGAASGGIVRSALGEAGPVTFAEQQSVSGAGRVGLDDNAAYWLTTTGTDHQVVSSPTPSGAPIPLGTLSPETSGGGVLAVVDLAVGPTSVYVLTFEGISGQLRAVAK